MSRADVIAGAPLTLARWLLLVSIVLSAWLFGSTRPWAAEFMTWWLLATGGLFLLGLAARRRLPRVPWVVVLPSLFLLWQGWFMVWNAGARFIPSLQDFIGIPQPMPGWPGVVDRDLAQPWMLRTTGLLAALWVACDAASNRIWRHRLWLAIAVTGTSVMVLGLAQRFTGATSIFWDTYRYTGEWFFAVYRYHANAGSYINLVLPMVTGLAVLAFTRRGSEGARVFWTLAALTTAACGFVNLSRAANVITAIMLLAMAVWIATLRLQATSSRRLLHGTVCGVVLTATVVYLAVSFDVSGARERWEKTKLDALLNDGRPEVYEIMARGTLEPAGAWGFGQGTFEFVFNNARKALQHPLAGRWDYAHSDGLQTVQDWGYAGAGAWFVIFACGLLRAITGSRRHGRRPDENSILSAAGAFALAGVLLHAWVDFPLQILSLQLYTLVILGMVVGVPRAESPSVGVRRRRASHRQEESVAS
jgi:hypothetical protein